MEEDIGFLCISLFFTILIATEERKKRLLCSALLLLARMFKTDTNDNMKKKYSNISFYLSANQLSTNYDRKGEENIKDELRGY